MSDWAIQRRSPRYPILLPFSHQPTSHRGAGTRVGWTRDLSEGGACLELDERLPVHTPLHIRLQTDRGAIELDAEVVWEVEEQGSGRAEGGVLHGVAFTHLAPDQLFLLRDLLLPKGHSRPAEVRVPADLPVTCQLRASAGIVLDGRTGDFSRGGLLLRLSQALPPGTPLDLTLHRPNGRVAAEGEIVWVDPPEKRAPGQPIRHGVRFTALGWSRELSLALLLAEPTEEPSPAH